MADEHDKEMEALDMKVVQETPEGGSETLPLRVDMLRALQGRIGHFIESDLRVLDPMYMEMLAAFCNIYVAVTREMLSQLDDVTIFQLARDQATFLLGHTSAVVQSLAKMDPEALTVVDTDGKVH